MTRRYGRAPRGQRCRGSAPYSHWQITTFVGALRRTGISAPMVIDEPMDGDVFLAYVEQVLVPTLSPGEIVILDNLGSHKVVGVQQAIQGAGATVLYLPPYSPGPEPHRKLLRQTQGPAAQSCQALHRDPLGRNRNPAPLGFLPGMLQLLHRFRVCKHLN